MEGAGDAGARLDGPHVMDDVTDASFEREVLESRLPVIVDFWAPWCKPCDAIKPHLRAIAEAHEGRVRLMRLNVDKEVGVPGRYGVLALPTVILFVDGEPRSTVFGAHSRAHYERTFEPHFSAHALESRHADIADSDAHGP